MHRALCQHKSATPKHCTAHITSYILCCAVTRCSHYFSRVRGNWLQERACVMWRKTGRSNIVWEMIWRMVRSVFARAVVEGICNLVHVCIHQLSPHGVCAGGDAEAAQKVQPCLRPGSVYCGGQFKLASPKSVARRCFTLLAWWTTASAARTPPDRGLRWVLSATNVCTDCHFIYGRCVCVCLKCGRCMQSTARRIWTR